MIITLNNDIVGLLLSYNHPHDGKISPVSLHARKVSASICLLGEELLYSIARGTLLGGHFGVSYFKQAEAAWPK